MIKRLSIRSALVLGVMMLLVVATYAAVTRPSITFEATAVDVGTVKQGQEVVEQFRFRNEGRSAASIMSVAPGCGLLVAPVQLQTLRPGEEGVIEVKLRTAFVEPYTRRSVAVTLRDPFERTVLLEMNGSIEPEFVVDTPVVDFGQLRVGGKVERVVNIRFNNAESQVLHARSTDEHFSPLIERAASLDLAQIVVTVQARGPAGMKFGTIRIGTSSSHMPELIIPVRSIVVE